MSEICNILLKGGEHMKINEHIKTILAIVIVIAIIVIGANIVKNTSDKSERIQGQKEAQQEISRSAK